MRALRVLRDRSLAHTARVEAEIGAAIAAGAGLLEVVAIAARAIDEAVTHVITRPEQAPPACAAGCSSCCHVHVDATAPEILAAAAHLTNTLDPEARSAIRDRLAAHAVRVEGLDDLARWSQRIPCALLADDGRCSIYEARPLRCRAFHASSADPCKAAFAGDADREPATIPAIDRAASAAEAGYDRAIAAAGVSTEAFRFEVGLSIALDDGSSGDRFEAGEDVFARARRARMDR